MVRSAQLTNAMRRMVASLGAPRSRREENSFVAEGTKCVLDLQPAFGCRYLIATARWLDENSVRLSDRITTIQATTADMQRMSQLKTPTEVIAVLTLPERPPVMPDLNGRLTIALDGVRDPGNLGTIIRAADWFGVDTIIASSDSVDAFNPKVVQATMGALARVKVHYVDNLATTLSEAPVPVYGTFLDGTDIYRTQLTADGIIVMGNEGRGISASVAATVSRKLFIPSWPKGRPTSESLNVAMATAITLAEFRRSFTA